MKILMGHCERLETVVREATSRGGSTFIEEALLGTKQKLGDSIVIFVCIEKKDEYGFAKAKKGAEEVRKVIKDTRLPLVIIPFVHLTSEIPSQKFAYIQIKELSTRLAEFYKVESLEFGWHRSLLLELLCGEYIFKYIEL